MAKRSATITLHNGEAAEVIRVKVESALQRSFTQEFFESGVGILPAWRQPAPTPVDAHHQFRESSDDQR